MRAGFENATIVHATAVDVAGAGVLLLGEAGSGKSSLALELLAFGSRLIADDRVGISRENGQPWLSAPPGLPPFIEARGVGLLNAPMSAGARADLVVDLDRTEKDRLPPRRYIDLLGRPVPMLHKTGREHFGIAIQHYLKHGWSTE